MLPCDLGMGEDSASIHALLRRWLPMGSWWGGEGGSRVQLRTYTVFQYLHSNLPTWCRSPDPNPPGNWPRKICFETASDWYRPSMLYSKILPASRKVHTMQHPAPAAINQPGGLVPGQEPAPSYPPVSSPPEFQSLGSPETMHRERIIIRYSIPHAGSLMFGQHAG